MNWRERISVDPRICHGKPCIAGTRVLVSVVVDNIAAGEPFAAVAQGYGISIEDVQAALAYAAELTKFRVLPLPAEVA